VKEVGRSARDTGGETGNATEYLLRTFRRLRGTLTDEKGDQKGDQSMLKHAEK
jgi:hypothetical protein